jgi:hypothetical protein
MFSACWKKVMENGKRSEKKKIGKNKKFICKFQRPTGIFIICIVVYVV